MHEDLFARKYISFIKSTTNIVKCNDIEIEVHDSPLFKISIVH